MSFKVGASVQTRKHSQTVYCASIKKYLLLHMVDNADFMLDEDAVYKYHTPH